MGWLAKRRKKKKLKKAERLRKLTDPYDFYKMSDEEIFKDVNKYVKKGIMRLVFGVLILVLCIVFLCIFWNDLFYV